jgi:hypothetical protein
MGALNTCDVVDGAEVIVRQADLDQPALSEQLTIKGMPFLRQSSELYVRVLPPGPLGYRSLADIGLAPYSNGLWHATAYTVRVPVYQASSLRRRHTILDFFDWVRDVKQDHLKKFYCDSCRRGYPDLIVLVPFHLRNQVPVQDIALPGFRLRLVHQN